MDQFESYLQYQKEITETKLKIINRFQKAVQPTQRKRTSKIEIARNVLHIAGRPLHVSEIIRLAQRDFQVALDRDSIVSAILKKVNAGKSFIRTAPNTFALKE
jgi:DNA-directed RNA polymerase delta subunit